MIFSVFAGDVQEGDWSGELGITPCWTPMPQEPPIGVCNPDIISRKYFALCEGVRLTVPGIIEDKFLRRLIVNENSLESSYKAVGISHLIPEEGGLHACIRDVLKTQRKDTSTGLMVPMPPGNMTCIEFWRCYADFINAKRQTGKTGRIKIGDNAFVPSLAEQECIRKDWLNTGDVAGAYGRCGAGDIIPWWQDGVSGLNEALRVKINVNIYDVLKVSYTMTPFTPTTPTTVSMEDLKLRKERLKQMAKEHKKTPAWIYAVIAFGIGTVILRR